MPIILENLEASVPHRSFMGEFIESPLHERDRFPTRGRSAVSHVSPPSVSRTVGEDAAWYYGPDLGGNNRIHNSAMIGHCSGGLHTYNADNYVYPIWQNDFYASKAAPEDRLQNIGTAVMLFSLFGKLYRGAGSSTGRVLVDVIPAIDFDIGNDLRPIRYWGPQSHGQSGVTPAGFTPGGTIIHGFSVMSSWTLHRYASQFWLNHGLRFGGEAPFDYYSSGETSGESDEPIMEGFSDYEVEEAGVPEDPGRPPGINYGYGEGWAVINPEASSPFGRPKGWSAMRVIPGGVFTSLVSHSGLIVSGGYSNNVTGQSAGGFSACAIAEIGNSRVAFLATKQPPWIGLVKWAAWLI